MDLNLSQQCGVPSNWARIVQVDLDAVVASLSHAGEELRPSGEETSTPQDLTRTTSETVIATSELYRRV